MTREELKAHCEKQIKMCEMWAKHIGEEPSNKIYEEHKLILELLEQEPCEDAISRQAVLDAFADYVGSGMSMNDFDALWNIVVKIQPVDLQKPKFIAKSDGTIEQIKDCGDCLFKKEWEKIGKLLSNILEKHTEQEPCEDAISRVEALKIATTEYELKKIRELPSVKPQEPKWDRLYSRLNDMRFGIAPDETVTDIDERHVRTAQVDMLDEIMEWMIEPQESENKE